MAAPSNQGRTLERALDILECVETARAPMKPAHVARETDLHITTVQRIASTLCRRGFLTLSDGGYLIGPVALAQAHTFLLQDRLSLVAEPVLQEITTATGLTSSVYVRTGWSRILVARIEAPTPLRHHFAIGQRLPLDVGSGKVLLAQMSEEELDEFLANYLPRTLANGTVQEAADIRAQVAAIHADRWHLGRSEGRPAISLTVPLQGSSGASLGSLSIISDNDKTDAEEMLGHHLLLGQAGRRIGSSL